MTCKSRAILLATALLALPMGAAMAQRSVADSTSGSMPRSAPTSPQMDSSSPATNPNQPGATGQTVVKGSNSSMAASHRVDPNPASQSENASGGGAH
jgi:hypothetical protein